MAALTVGELKELPDNVYVWYVDKDDSITCTSSSFQPAWKYALNYDFYATKQEAEEHLAMQNFINKMRGG